MGAPSDDDIDDAWTSDGPAQESPAQKTPAHDQTTHGFYVEPPAPRSDGPDKPIVLATADLSVVSVDPRGGSTGPEVARRPFSVLGSSGITTPREEERKLVQPERSPLAFVMGDESPDAVPRPARSHDSSRFVADLIGDQQPPTVDNEVPVIPTMQPALRRARLRRQWGAIAAAGVVGVVVAIKLATSSHAPRVAPPAAPAVAQAPAPAPSTVVPEPPPPSPASGSAAEPEPVAPPPPEQAAPPVALQAPVVAKPAPAPAKASSSKKSSSTKHTSTAVAKHSSAAKKPSTTKKVTAAKKSTPPKKVTAAKKSPKKKSSS